MSEVGKKFKDLGLYNTTMSKAIKDKLFFIDILPKENEYIYVDFGCADGALLKELSKNSNFVKGIGYDCSSLMLEEARKNISSDSVIFTAEWLDVLEQIEDIPYNVSVVLILSSVIHEVYSYASSDYEISQFWDKVFNSNFDYVVIRDMIPSKTISRPSLEEHVEAVIENSISRYITDFQSFWGTFYNNKNLVHYLLKYRYIINWDREVLENYFPLYSEDLLKKIEGKILVYYEPFIVPFINEQIKKDFNINLTDFTHLKLIFKP